MTAVMPGDQRIAETFDALSQEEMAMIRRGSAFHLENFMHLIDFSPEQDEECGDNFQHALTLWAKHRIPGAPLHCISVAYPIVERSAHLGRMRFEKALQGSRRDLDVILARVKEIGVTATLGSILACLHAGTAVYENERRQMAGRAFAAWVN